MSSRFLPLARALRRPPAAPALLALTTQTLLLCGCECPEARWTESTAPATASQPVEAKLLAWIEANAALSPAERLRALHGLNPAANAPARPYGYFGPAQAALLRDAADALGADLCAAICGEVLGAYPGPTEPAVGCEAKATEAGPALWCRWFNQPECIGGRRPAGLRAPTGAFAPDARAAWWAALAHEEAAAVHAFARLLRDLHGLGAPDGLLRATARALADEVHHAAAAARRAHGLGAPIRQPEVAPYAPRDRLAIATENVTAGCVLEAFAALEAVWQAGAARDPVDRQILARIAADEVRHAALSAQLDGWLRAGLTAPERGLVAAAHGHALAALAAQVAQRPTAPEDLRAPRAVAQQLCHALHAAAYG